MPPAASTKALDWQALAELTVPEADRINGPTNAQATLRLFGQSEKA
ncbi:MAG: glutathione S-transferase, partial [Cyanobacteriota bacterium]|nr:glutathione S-transferase [Cyanobacteriota bacterium]